MPTSPGPLLEAVEALWAHLRSHVPLLPAARFAVVTTPAVAAHPSDRLSWEREGVVKGLTIASETVEVGGDAVAEAVFHDAAHVYCWVGGVEDTASRGRYHKGTFRSAAEEVGMEWPADATRDSTGFSAVRLTGATREEYAPYLARLRDVAPQVVEPLVASDPARPRRDRITLSCSCKPTARTFRITETVADLGPITCGVCGKPFTST